MDDGLVLCRGLSNWIFYINEICFKSATDVSLYARPSPEKSFKSLFPMLVMF